MKAHSQNKKYRFPWQPGNHFKLLIDGPVYFPAMLSAIEQAQSYILLEMYLVETGSVTEQFIQALCDAADKDVKVFILFDDYGALDLSSNDRNRLLHNNIFLIYYNPLHLRKHKLLLFRDHRKMLVIDGNTAYIGGAGLTDDFYSSKNPELNWRENMLEIRGSNVHQWQTLFASNWSRWSDIEIPLQWPTPHQGSQQGRVTRTEGPRVLESKRSALKGIEFAMQNSISGYAPLILCLHGNYVAVLEAPPDVALT